MLSEVDHMHRMEALADERTTLEVFLVQESLRLYRSAQRTGYPAEIVYQRRGVRDAVARLRERRTDLALPVEHVVFARPHRAA
jgi:hypothetical protein